MLRYPLFIAVSLSTVGCIKANLTTRHSDQTGSSSSSSSESSSSLGTAAIPAGAVIPFDAAVCPSGWTAFDAAKGRVIFGDGSGNNDADSTPLMARTLGASGGLEYTTGIPATSLSANLNFASGGTGVLAASAIGTQYRTVAPDVWVSGGKADSNVPPFVARLFCKNAADVASVPASAHVKYELAACPATGWTTDSAVEGRVIVGVGSGNNDGAGAALTIRALNDVGGREFTTGIPVSSQPANQTTVGPTASLAESSLEYFIGTYPGAPIDFGGGDGADSNMPPFVALKPCIRDISPLTEMASGAVVAFDSGTCPSGWSNYSAGNGRTLVGVGSSNVDADGTALTARTLSTTGGREFTAGFPVQMEVGEDTNASVINSLCVVSNGNIFRNAPADTTVAGPKADSNMPPYYVLHYCKKD